MNNTEAIEKRHSVRTYKNIPINNDIVEELQSFISSCNQESGLNIQLILNEPKAFSGLMARYGKFSGVQNYLAIVGKKGSNNEEKSGYFGEKIVIKAQQLGLNSCWVGMTYSKVKNAFKVEKDEKLYIVIALGYGETNGVEHKSKDIKDLVDAQLNYPTWFLDGVKMAQLAPTALNQQKFQFSLQNDRVNIKAGMGFNTKIDLGIVKYHFEVGAGKDNFHWV